MRPASERAVSMHGPDRNAAGLLASARRLGRRTSDGAGWLLEDVDLEVSHGERIGLAGPTGAGKSLVLRALALLDPVDRGEVLWRGRTIPDAEVPAYRSRVVYLQQRSPLVEGSVEENLRLPFSWRRQAEPPSRERLAALVESAGREAGFLGSRIDHLSGGERQTVALLRALLIEPEVLLLDEPTSALDRESAATVERLVAGWLAEGEKERAYVWVSHDPSQLDRMVDRIVSLESGRMVAP